MGEKFWFFTDPDFLELQTPANAFGPAGVQGAENVFRVTHRHEATASAGPAIAVCDGILCAQSDGAGGLTLILKPTKTPPFEMPVVDYFIYRGISPSSFSNGAPLIDANSAPGTGSSPPKIFTNLDPLERLFAYPHDPVQTHRIKGGSKIGEYAAKLCCFEIVLRRIGGAPSLDFVRRADATLGVPTIAANNGGNPWQPNDPPWFDHWCDKDRALGFMDPCAYFGCFAQAQLHVAAGSAKGRVTGDRIFEKLLAKAVNRDVAWLDIRGNSNCSYNLFGLYGDLLRFDAGGPALDYRKDGWPLLRLRLADVSGEARAGLWRAGLVLPVGKSQAPAVLVSKGFATTARLDPVARTPKMTVDTSAAAVPLPDPANPGTNLAFYAPVGLAFPLATDGNTTVLAASYTRVNFYERTRAAAIPAPSLDLAGSGYPEGLFRLDGLQLDANFRNHALRFDIFWEEVLVDLGPGNGPVYAAAIGIAADANQVALLAIPTHFLPSAGSVAPHQPVSLTARFGRKRINSFEKWLTKSFTDVRFTRTTIAALQADAVIAREFGVEPKPGRLGEIDDYCIVVLDRTDHDAMRSAIAAAPGFAGVRPVFLRVSASVGATDSLTNASYTGRTLCASVLASAAAAPLAWSDAPWSRQVVEYAYP